MTGDDMPGAPVAVSGLAVAGGTLFVTGQFVAAAGRARPGLAAFDVASGALSPWAPLGIDWLMGFALTAGAGTVYVSGDFGFDGGACDALDRRRPVGLVAVDVGTGATTRWCAGLGPVLTLAATGDRVFVGGGYDSVVDAHHSFLRVLSAATGALGGWDPRPNGMVTSVVTAGDGVLAGGEFGGLDRRPRSNGAALDLRTGEPLAFDASVAPFWDTGPVHAIATHGDHVFAAGEFERIGGRRRPALAKLDARTGRASAWNAHVGARGRPYALAGRLYVGGDFRRVGRRHRAGLVAVDAATGEVQPWRADARAPVRAVAVLEGTVYAGGDFTSIQGVARRHLAAVDAYRGTLTAWNPGADDRVSALLATPTALVVGGPFTALGGTSQTGLGIFARSG